MSRTEEFERALKTAEEEKNANLVNWLKQELDGYGGKDVPEYRKVRARSVCWNPVRREYIPLVFEQKDMNELFSAFPIKNSLREIESSIGSVHPDGNIYLSFSQEAEKMLIRGGDMLDGMRPAVQISLPVMQDLLSRIDREYDRPLY